MHLILRANFRKKQWRGITIEIGEVVSSYNHLSQQTGLTIQEVKTALKHLEETGEIKKRSTNKYTVLTITKYNKYQQTRTINGGVVYDSPEGENWDELDEDIGDGFDDWDMETEEESSEDNNLPILTHKQYNELLDKNFTPKFNPRQFLKDIHKKRKDLKALSDNKQKFINPLQEKNDDNNEKENE